MSATASTNLIYPLTDFVASAGTINTLVLKQELINAGLSVTVGGVSPNSTTCTIVLLGTPTATDITKINAVVAAHTGTAFSPTLKTVYAEAVQSDDSGNEVVLATLTTGVMPAGVYLSSWYVELATASYSTTTGSCGRVKYNLSGSGDVEGAITTVGSPAFTSFSGALAVVMKDGDTYVNKLTLQRVGTSGNAAKAQRARMTWVKIG